MSDINIKIIKELSHIISERPWSPDPMRITATAPLSAIDPGQQTSSAMDDQPEEAALTKEKIKKDIIKSIKKDPELDSALKTVAVVDIKNTKLFFDGHYLYWLVGGKVTKRWAATSGKYDRLAIYHWEARVIFSAIKKLQNDKNKQKEDIVSDLRNFVDYIPNLKDPNKPIQDSVWISNSDAERIYDSWQTRDRAKIFSSFKYVFDRYDIIIPMTSDEKREATAEKNIGPIPEGSYKIVHKLHQTKFSQGVDPTVYDVLWWAMSDFIGKNSDKENLLPYLKISDKEFEKVIGKNMTANGPSLANMHETINWGEFRLRITKISNSSEELIKRGAGYNKRDGFFIHGGAAPGSAGCIDIGDAVSDFAKFWTASGLGKAVFGGGRSGTVKMSDFVIPLHVKYSDKVKGKLIDNNVIAKTFQDLIFK